MENECYTPKYPLQTLSKALEILNYIKDCPSSEGITLNAISKNLGISKSSAHRILDTLLSYGFVEKNNSAITTYRLSWAAYRVGSAVPKYHTLNSSNYVTVLESLSNELQQTVNINVLDGNYIISLYKSDPNNPIPSRSFFGQHSPLYATAAGKLFMLNFTKDEILNYFKNVEIKKYTSNTILNYIDFLEELEKIKTNGFSTDFCEYNENSVCIALPVKDYTSQIVAAVSVTDTPEVMTEERLQIIKPKLESVCKSLSKYLGY